VKLPLVRHAAAVLGGTPGVPPDVPDDERPSRRKAGPSSARRILSTGRLVPIAADRRPALRSQERLYEATGAGGIFA